MLIKRFAKTVIFQQHIQVHLKLVIDYIKTLNKLFRSFNDKNIDFLIL